MSALFPQQPEAAPSSRLNNNRRRRRILVAVVFALLVLAAVLLSLRRSGQDELPAGASVTGSGDAPALKLSLAEPGIYRLSGEQLSQAGWTAGLDEPERVLLTFQGHPQPFWIEQNTGVPSLVFYAQPTNSLYSKESVFILQDNQAITKTQEIAESAHAAALQPLPVGANQPAGSIFYNQRLEQNLLYLPQAEGEERWYWLPLSAPISQTVTVPVLDLAFQAGEGECCARLAVQLYSSTEAPQATDHSLRLLVNGQQVAEESWDGKGLHQIESWFDLSLLKEGENQLSLVAPGVEGVAADLSHLDWIEIGYPRLPQAVDDRLEFWSSAGQVELAGFTGAAAVFDITDPTRAEVVETQSLGDGKILFNSQADHHYLAAGPGGYLSPAAITPPEWLPNLRAPGSGADYIVIGPPDLLEPLDPLLDLRAGQGLATAAVPLQAVYDQFSHGLVSPQAIQDFMRYAAASWQPAPRYLLLVGDASYDPKGYQSPSQANRMVVPLVDTVYGGQTTSDVPFVQVNDDDWPDLAVGLVPAQTAEQVKVFVQKTLSYESRASGTAGAQSILAVADGSEAGFRSDAKAFLGLYGPDVREALIAPQSGETDAASQVGQELEAGVSLLAYFGHGSLNMWGKDRLFSAEDAAQLRNMDHLPVVLNMTCLTGLYTHPKVESLAEALLFNPQGGAAAVLAPSSLTLAIDQSFLSRPLAEGMLQNPELTLGEVHLSARRQISLNTPGMRDVMMTFMLFGDPALSLPDW